MKQRIAIISTLAGGSPSPEKLVLSFWCQRNQESTEKGHQPDCNKRIHRGRLPRGDPRAECKEKIHKIGEGVESRQMTSQRSENMTKPGVARRSKIKMVMVATMTIAKTSLRLPSLDTVRTHTVLRGLFRLIYINSHTYLVRQILLLSHFIYR